MFDKLLTIITLTLLTIAIHLTFARQIFFEENITSSNHKINSTGRLPLYAPSRCKTNELLYPGNQEHDWICDCAPGALYYPEADACYPAYRQGPCKNGQILTLTAESDILPSCISNVCQTDGQISINEKCYELETPGPCRSTFLNRFVLSVNSETLKVDCIPLTISFGPRFGYFVLENQLKSDARSSKSCTRGTKRAIQDLCKVNSN